MSLFRRATATPPTGTDPQSMPDADLYDRLTAEFPQWLAAARSMGIVR